MQSWLLLANPQCDVEHDLLLIGGGMGGTAFLVSLYLSSGPQVVHTLSHLVFPVALGDKLCSSHFTKEETKWEINQGIASTSSGSSK